MGDLGLTKGHEGAIPQTISEERDGLVAGLVSLDANVLLSFYRFSPSARFALTTVFEALGDRVFVSHQAAREFWRNRLAAIDARNSATEQLGTALTKAENQIREAIRVWAKQTAVEDATEHQMNRDLRAAFEACSTTADEMTNEPATFAYNIEQDSVTQALLPLLTDRVGPPLSPGEHAAALTEAQRRLDAGLPPGFRDKDKENTGSSDGASGDYLVWLQSMNEAKARSLPLVLVTGDEKEDWWWKHRGHLLGPRSELVEECQKNCGCSLIMLRPHQLIKHADVLQVAVSDEALSDVERGTTSDDPVWSDRAVQLLLTRLEHEGREQEMVIRYAAQHGGSIERDALYKVCDYQPDRMLRGFTRPSARITADLIAEGHLDDGVTAMLTPVYEGGVQALRFEIPQEVVTILVSPGETAEERVSTS